MTVSGNLKATDVLTCDVCNGRINELSAGVLFWVSPWRDLTDAMSDIESGLQPTQEPT